MTIRMNREAGNASRLPAVAEPLIAYVFAERPFDLRRSSTRPSRRAWNWGAPARRRPVSRFDECDDDADQRGAGNCQRRDSRGLLHGDPCRFRDCSASARQADGDRRSAYVQWTAATHRAVSRGAQHLQRCRSVRADRSRCSDSVHLADGSRVRPADSNRSAWTGRGQSAEASSDSSDLLSTTRAADHELRCVIADNLLRHAGLPGRHSRISNVARALFSAGHVSLTRSGDSQSAVRD